MSKRRVGVLGAAVAAVLVLAAFPAGGGAAGWGDRLLLVNDECEPASFNAVLGPGACVGDGTVTFGAFIAELAQTKTVEAWNFSPEQLNIAPRGRLRAVNRGGEFHTVTRVAEFGGGFVPILNELAGTPIPAPECFTPPGPSNLFLEAGESGVLTTGPDGALGPGANKLLCCVHPWMRSTVHVRSGARGL